MSAETISFSLQLPDPVAAILRALRAEKHSAWVVGECLHELCRGARPRSFALATSATPDALLETFPRAVPTRPQQATVTIPSAAGPVDATLFRNTKDIHEDLTHRDFTIHAMAYDPLEEQLLDPFGGRDDLAARRLKAVGRPEDRFAEDPLRALQAARLCSVYDYRPDAALEAALPALRPRLRSFPAVRVRRAVTGMLMGARPSLGIALLRRTGLEAELAPGAGEDAGLLVEALPPELPLRMAAWLRGAPMGRIGRRLRLGRELTDRAVRLLAHHPIERAANPARYTSLRRLLRRLPEPDLGWLFLLRERELEIAQGEPRTQADAAALAILRAAIERARASEQREDRRVRLSLDGRAVMQALGCAPGRRVGQALRFLTERVDAGQVLNAPDALRSELTEWAIQHPE